MQFNQAQYDASYGTALQLPASELPEIVFAGRSNVGKSSMLNALFSRKNLARVSSSPGKTATINFYRLKDVYFVDLPGYGYAKVSHGEKARFSKLIDGYFSKERDWLLVALLLDMRHPPSKLDMQMINFLIDAEFPFLLLLTKADKLSANQQKERLTALQKEVPCGDQITMVPFSSKTRQGVEEFQEILQELCSNNI